MTPARPVMGARCLAPAHRLPDRTTAPPPRPVLRPLAGVAAVLAVLALSAALGAAMRPEPVPGDTVRLAAGAEGADGTVVTGTVTAAGDGRVVEAVTPEITRSDPWDGSVTFSWPVTPGALYTVQFWRGNDDPASPFTYVTYGAYPGVTPPVRVSGLPRDLRMAARVVTTLGERSVPGEPRQFIAGPDGVGLPTATGSALAAPGQAQDPAPAAVGPAAPGAAGATGPVTCATPPTGPVLAGPAADALLRAAFASACGDLAPRSGVPAEQVHLMSAERVTWSDGSRGCGQPGGLYTQALVPGVRLVLRAGGREWAYHGGEDGGAVWCPGASTGPSAGGTTSSTT